MDFRDRRHILESLLRLERIANKTLKAVEQNADKDSDRGAADDSRPNNAKPFGERSSTVSGYAILNRKTDNLYQTIYYAYNDAWIWRRETVRASNGGLRMTDLEIVGILRESR